MLTTYDKLFCTKFLEQLTQEVEILSIRYCVRPPSPDWDTRQRLQQETLNLGSQEELSKIHLPFQDRIVRVGSDVHPFVHFPISHKREMDEVSLLTRIDNSERAFRRLLGFHSISCPTFQQSLQLLSSGKGYLNNHGRPKNRGLTYSGLCECRLPLTVIPARLLPDEPGSIPGRVTPGFSHVGIVPDDTAGRQVFSVIFRLPRPFIPALLHTRLNHPHLISRPPYRRERSRRKVAAPGRAYPEVGHPASSECGIAITITVILESFPGVPLVSVQAEIAPVVTALGDARLTTQGGRSSIEPTRVERDEYRKTQDCNGVINREIPKNTRRPAPSSGTIPTCDNPRTTRTGSELSSPRWGGGGQTNHDTTAASTSKSVQTVHGKINVISRLSASAVCIKSERNERERASSQLHRARTLESAEQCSRQGVRALSEEYSLN
ncbi:hypothetical protein PR048_019789 [Dryococelus australis]|uniref:Uncharacterized protein n=1 Tax=Dryococelus australis TaxID=614101 RepID=A0ABQ9H4F9_9NEOP|nr:hypothetical protein PR048_019789 [Dryococelus australis]